MDSIICIESRKKKHVRYSGGSVTKINLLYGYGIVPALFSRQKNKLHYQNLDVYLQITLS